ncbi:MAG: A/G-specific adenine glycosylase [Dehalococcoidia bacterium]
MASSTGSRKKTHPLEAEPLDRGTALSGLDAWYVSTGRHALPWRLTRDPYAVLVSEVMLQQTQVSRVLPAYAAWLGRWPTLPHLAAAAAGDVIRQWSGLGYNRRALNLHRAAAELLEQGSMDVPIESGRLESLPGIGPYTAAAVASFAGEQPGPVVDTNIGRVLARHRLGLNSPREATPTAVWRLAGQYVPQSGPESRHHNLALMDLGALVCRAAAPLCEACPVAATCRWLAAGRPAAVRAGRKAPRFETTDRYARGRVIDALRLAPRSLAALAEALPPQHAAGVEGLLAGLARDGLVVAQPGAMWALPGDL